MTRLLDIKGRSLLTLEDLTDAEMLDLIDLAAGLKAERRAGICRQRLAGRQIAMIFEKLSTRTRCAASVAAAEEGGRTEYLAAHEIHLGKKESVADTARVLGRMFDGILFRGYRQETVKTMAAFSGVPVWNGLTDTSHPTQALADLLTVQESFGRLAGLRVAYVGDGRNNVACSLMLACAKAGMHFVNGTPDELTPDAAFIGQAEAIAARNGGSVSVVRDPVTAVAGANVVTTDVWVSMGEESQQEARLNLLRPYQVNMDLMLATGNMESGKVIFLHCLPAFHDANTEATRECGALEVTDDVFESDFSKVFDEAENRMHTIKAIFVACL
jgi:ornithine carbamoyltransferase